MGKKPKNEVVVTQEMLDENPALEESGVKLGDMIESLEQEEPTMVELVKGMVSAVTALNTRVEGLSKDMHDIKTGGRDKFKQEIKDEDVAIAAENRKGVDARICQIVDETLGTDFGIEMFPLGDRPGFFLNIIVPHRLNDNVVDMRPVIDKNTGGYAHKQDGSVMMEAYKLPDKRGRVLSTADSFDTIRQHCEKVRAYMTAYYQRQNRPMPDLKVA